MQKVEQTGSVALRSTPLGTRIWRDLGRLAAEAAVIGALFSVLLAAGVLMMSLMSRGARIDATNTDAPSSTSRAVQPTT